MPDRFQEYDKPPKTYLCGICSYEVEQGYEKYCSCGRLVCEDCVRGCWVCETKACRWCIEKKDCNGQHICEICLSNRDYLVSETLAGIHILDYYHSGTEDSDEEIILEFSSNEHNPIKVCISKVRE